MPSPKHFVILLILALGCGSDDSEKKQTNSQNNANSQNSANNLNSTNNANSSNNNGPTDITDAVFERRDPSCDAYAGSYVATVTDVANETEFESTTTITSDGTDCTLTSNSIPNHDFNDMGQFANRVAEVVETFTIPGSPTNAAAATALTLNFDNAVFLNGVKLDLLAAACYGVGNEPLGEEKIGCFQYGTPWRYDPMFSGNSFGTDSNNAHTQPDGAYHYHGDPLAMYDTTGATESGVIGFAADGYPIFGPFIDDEGTIRRVRSSFALRSGARESKAGEGAFPGGEYDGTFVDDYEYLLGSGDLDECNGMTRNGVYGYYVTDAYPWIVACFKGTPDPSFSKM